MPVLYMTFLYRAKLGLGLSAKSFFRLLNVDKFEDKTRQCFYSGDLTHSTGLPNWSTSWDF